jgi:ubiquitin C-terminal hydrolase
MATCNIEMLKLVFTFLANYVNIRSNHLETMPTNEICAFFRLFEQNFPFYLKMNSQYEQDFYENLLKDVFTPLTGPVEKILTQDFKKLNNNTNYFYRYFLTYAMYTNFFPSCVSFLSTPFLEFDKFQFIHRGLAKISYEYEHYDPNLTIKTIQNITSYFQNLFNNNQVKELNKVQLENFFSQAMLTWYYLASTLPNMYDSQLEELLKIELNMIYFLILSSNFEKRMLGWKSLNDSIGLILQYEKMDEKAFSGQNNNIHKMIVLSEILKIKKRLLIDWLEKINIFQIIFGENMHEAILKKSSFVLVYLYVNNKLSFEQIDYIWKISQDKHEAISGSILNIFSDLISSLSIEHAMHILKVINEVAFKDVNEVTIKILDSFSNNKNLNDKSNILPPQGPQVNNLVNDVENNLPIETNINQMTDSSPLDINILQGNNDPSLFNIPSDTVINIKDVNDFKAFYLKILWKYSSENSFYNGISPTIINKARKVLSSILVKPLFKYELAKYVKKCIIGIGCNHMLSTHLSILEMIMKNLKKLQSDDENTARDVLLSSFGNDVKDIKSFFTYLERQYSLSTTLLNAIIDIKKEVMIYAGEIINLHNNILTSNDKNISSQQNVHEVLNNFESKFLENPENFFKNMQSLVKEESKENTEGTTVITNQRGNNLEQELNIMIESDDIRLNQADNAQNNNDETLSTEKSLDNSISTISTDISSLEKSRVYIVRDFIENNITYFDKNSMNNQLQDNYDMIFKHLKLNYSKSNYYSIVQSLLEFFKYLIFTSNGIQLLQNQIEYLFVLLVENAVDEEEMNIYFNFIADVFKMQQMTKQIYIAEENIKYILFEVLLKIELASLPFSGFNLFKQIFYLINSNQGNLVIVSQKIVDVGDFSQLIGFETLWKFYLETKSSNVLIESQSMLVNLIATIAKREDNKDSFLFIFDKIFTNLEFNFDALKGINIQNRLNSFNNPNNMEGLELGNVEYEEQTKRLLNLLFIVNSTKQKISKPRENETVTIQVQNYYFNNDIKKSPLIVHLDITVKELKQIIINKILFPVSENQEDINANNYKPLIDDSTLMILYSNGKNAKNDKLTLRDLKFENGTSVQVHKNEYGVPMEVEMDPLRVDELVQQIRFIFDVEDEVLKRALKKNSYNIEDTTMFLLDENNIMTINQEIAEESAMPSGNDVQSKLNFELFNEEKINLLVNFLDLEIAHLNQSIWQLLSAIKFPQHLINNLIEPGNINFQNIFNLSHPNQLLLYLRILNCLVFNDKYFLNLNKLEDSKRSEWKMNLLITDGINLLVDSISELVKKLKKEAGVRGDIYISVLVQCLQIFSNWLHYFTFSTAIAISPNKEHLTSTIKMIIHKRPAGITIGVVNQTSTSDKKEQVSQKDSSSNATPTFGSPHSSFSQDIKNPSQQNKQQKAFSILGAEEYENNYEEELATQFYIKLIADNIHLTILDFIEFASRGENIPKFSTETEPVYMSVLEILMILNEINPQAFKDTVAYEVEKGFIINLLFVEKSKFVRKVVENLIIILTQSKALEGSSIVVKIKEKQIKTNNIKELVMKHILNNYKRIYSESVYEEFFNLFGYMLIQEKDINNSENFEDFNVGDLAMHIVGNIYGLSLKSDSEMDEIEQEQLSGNIYLFQCLCTNHELVIIKTLENFSQTNNINIVEFIYNNLFCIQIPNSNEAQFDYESVKFKYSGKNLRQKTYNLLLSLMRLKENYKKELSAKMISHHTNFRNEKIGNIDLDIGLRGKGDKIIGLRNYGCTCYLNALVQQLYMIPDFRRAIYSVEINEKFIEGSDETLDKNPLYQLQLVFANLSHSLKQFHTPIHFIRSIKAFGGEPINVKQQQDCEEFLNILTDRLEQEFKIYNKENIFDDKIKCRISSEVISLEKEYPYYSEQENPHLAISLDIKNKRTLEEALDLFIKGEALEGENKINVEKYDKKISILKRCSIKKLSNNVVIHLKRFEFDYNTFERIKINDYCEFPMTIDFKPWMRTTILQQNRDDPNFKDIVLEEDYSEMETDAYKYQLTGVLVHSGSSADSGHYYSFIFDQASQKWFRYDDNRVTEFDESGLKAECFGDDASADSYFKCKNAYLLFYSKIKNKEECHVLKDHVPENIMREIKEENLLFLKYKTYMDNDYFIFLREFLDYALLKNKSVDKLSSKEKSMSKRDIFAEEVYCQVAEMIRKYDLEVKNPEHFEKIKSCFLQIKENVTKTHLAQKQEKRGKTVNLKKKLIKLALFYYFEIIVNQPDHHKTTSYANFIRDIIETDRNTSCWFLKTMIQNRDLFVEFILARSSSEVRDGVSKIITNCIFNLFSDEEKYLKEKFFIFDIVQIQEREEIIVRSEFRSSVMRFFKNNILDYFDEIRQYWRTYNQFLQILFDCLNTNVYETAELAMEEKLYSRIIYMLMNNQRGFQTVFPTMGSKNINPPGFEFLIVILTSLVISCITDGVYRVKKYSIHSKYQNNKHFLNLPKDWQIILDQDVLGYNILRKFCNEHTQKLIHHLAWGNQEVSQRIIQVITSTFKE